jgi:CheY-like chemotaxis protein
MAASVLARAAPMVLVVDDEPDIRETIAEALMLEGYRVRTAPNGKSALEQARKGRPDLILLDLMMPVMSGWQFLEAWREDPELGSIPVVVDTAFPDVQVEGAAVLLRKPFDLTTLLTTISRLCDGDREISTKSNSTS